ncbi:MAG: hypothetical protein R3C14_11360 [Caldilineaceae bacterium]
MATKKKDTAKKRSISSARPRSYSELYKDDKSRTPVTPTTKAPKAVTTAPVNTPAKLENWREEYDYVIRDLRTLTVVSGVLFAVIIVAGFFI